MSAHRKLDRIMSSIELLSICSNSFTTAVATVFLLAQNAEAIIVPHRIIRSWYTVHWPMMGGLWDMWDVHLVQRGGDWAGPPINGQCTNHRIAV